MGLAKLMETLQNYAMPKERIHFVYMEMFVQLMALFWEIRVLIIKDMKKSISDLIKIYSSPLAQTVFLLLK